uniref:non-specific serine/threonine protein kinase n=1 Tax=Arcella intermedia TaxID=1963864 RepID=A0A6B2L2R1_9EUKA
MPQEIEVDPSNFIEKGAFGSVYRGKCRGKDVAIKILHKPITDQETLIAFKQEVSIMSTIFHPNICLFMGACTQPGRFFIVQEYMPGGDVEKLLRNPHVSMTLYRRMQMAYDAALGVNWLHCSNPAFIHRDLKSSNLLVDDNGKVKVCDFGLAQVKPNAANLIDEDHARGTPLWMAPEVMQFKEFNEKADVYSFGIVLWELLTRKEPFSHHKVYSKFRKAVCEKYERPEIPEDTVPSLARLIKQCWAPDPKVRPSFKEIITHLEHILVDVAVSDEIGRTLWKEYFLGQERVEWGEFVKALVATLGLKINDPQFKDTLEIHLKCLNAVLVTHPKSHTGLSKGDIVTVQNWGRILMWFGPIKDPQTTPQNDTFMQYLSRVIQEPWFHGDTDPQRALELLTAKPNGTFMVRFSSVDGWYTISQNIGRQIQHQRVSHVPGGPYIIDNDSYTDLHDLVERRGLKQPCEGSKYALLFGDNQTPYYNPYNL